MVPKNLIKNMQSRFDLPIQYLRALRSYDPQKKRTSLPGPLFVQIQTIDKCNASCGMCPYSSKKKKTQARYMDQKLYAHILDMLKKAGTVRLLSPMLQSEPLLDPFIVSRIKLAKDVLGSETMVSIVTNGSMLTYKRICSLAEAGIDRIEISIDAVDEATYQKLRPGLSFSRVIKNTKKLIAEYSKINVVVRFLYHQENKGQEKTFRCYWKKKGANVLFTPIVNRAGFVECFDKVNRSKYGASKQLKKHLWRLLIQFVAGAVEPSQCVFPFSWMYVLTDGRAILCCHDWGPIDVVGNLQTQTFDEVWNGEKLNMYRHFLWTNKYSKSPVCRNCSVVKGGH